MFSFFFFFNDTATTEIYTFPYTTLFRSNRQHGNDGSNSKNHTEHGEQRAQLVAGEVLKAKGHIRQPLRQGSWFGQGASGHLRANRFISHSDPGTSPRRSLWPFRMRGSPD